MTVGSTNNNSLRKCLLRESELTLPKAISAGHAIEDFINMPAKFLSETRPSISKRFQNISNVEIKPLLILQAQLKNESFVKILTTMVYVLPMENFAITITGKNILSFLYIIENLSTKFKKPKLNQLLLTNTNFSLIQ